MPWRPPPTSSARSTPKSGPSRRACGWRSGSTPASRPSPTTATSGWTCTWQRGSARPRTVVRSSSRRRPGTSRSTTGSDVSLRCLGDHRLKHVPRPQTLYQLVAPGLAVDFPPLSALGGSTLPALHHRLVGRRDDLAATHDLLTRPDVRLVTITGPGGAGKSRLALEAASRAALERPVHLVGLASISDAALVPGAIASVVGVREAPEASLTDLLAEALEGTRALLFLDNLEQLPDATPDIAALLDRVSDLDVLATSRSPLRIRGEHVVPLSSLPTQDAATLFFELAAARGVPLDEESLATVRGDLPAPRRSAARDRAGHGPARSPLTEAASRRPRRRPRARDGRPRRSPRPAADAARDARLELRAPDRRPATPPRPTGRLRRRQRARGRRGRRRLVAGDPRRPRGSRRGRACSGATPPMEPCGCRCSRPCGRTRSDASPRRRPSTTADAATQTISWRSPNGPRRGSPVPSRRAGLQRAEDELDNVRAALDWCLAERPRRRRTRGGLSARSLLARPRSRRRGATAPRPRPRRRRRSPAGTCEPGRSGRQPTRRWRNPTIPRRSRRSRRR